MQSNVTAPVVTDVLVVAPVPLSSSSIVSVNGIISRVQIPTP